MLLNPINLIFIPFLDLHFYLVPQQLQAKQVSFIANVGFMIPKMIQAIL